MRILIIGTSVVPIGTNRYGGIEKLCLDFIEGLLAQNHEVAVACPFGSKLPIEAQFIPTVRLPEQQDADDTIFPALRAYGSDFDIIHDFSHKHPISMMGLPAVFMVYDPIINAYPRPTYNNITLSKWQQQRLEERQAVKSQIMQMCVDSHKYHPKMDAKRERYLFLGKLSPEKGPDIAIAISRQLNIPMDIVGGLIPTEKHTEYVNELRRACGPETKLHFNVTEEEKIQFLQDAKAVIYPARQEEAHWLSGIEAWMCGTPTIAFDKGAMKEIHPFSSMILTNWTQMADIPNMADNLLQKTSEIAKFGYDHYSRDVVIPKWVSLYERVVEGLKW